MRIGLGFHEVLGDFEDHVRERPANTHRRHTSPGGDSQLSKLEPPRPLFRKSSRDTASQGGSSDFSSTGGDLLPEEEQELAAHQNSKPNLAIASLLETAQSVDHPHARAAGSSTSQTTTVHLASVHNPINTSEIDDGNGCSSASFLEDDRTPIKPAHRRIFSFIPGDDSANAKPQSAKGTHTPKSKSSHSPKTHIDKVADRDRVDKSRNDQISGKSSRQHGLFGSKR